MYLGRFASGLEEVVREEVERSPSLFILQSFPGGIIFDTKNAGTRAVEAESETLQELQKLRSVDNLYAFVCRSSDGDLNSFKYLEDLLSTLPEGQFNSAVDLARKWNPTLSQSNSEVSFRVTCERRHSNSNQKHSFSSMQAAAALGGSVVTETQWKVSMKKFDVEVLLWLFDKDVIVALSLFYPKRTQSSTNATRVEENIEEKPCKKHAPDTLRVDKTNADKEENAYRWVTERQLYALRSYRSALVPTSLKPSTAYSLCCLARITRKDFVLDPM